MTLAPVALICYRRLGVLRRAVEALQKNELADRTSLVVYSDGPRTRDDAADVEDVRRYLRTITGFSDVRIVERAQNLGLEENVIQGVSDVIREAGRVIVLEDDLVTAPGFLRFMNDALDQYAGDDRVISVLGYSYFSVPANPSDIYFVSRQADCLGWATWARGWALFERDGGALLQRIRSSGAERRFDRDGAYPYTHMLREQASGATNSWAVRWYASAFVNEKFSIYPQKSLVLHIGNAPDATNYDISADDPLNVPLYEGRLTVPAPPPTIVGDGDAGYREFVSRVGRRSVGAMVRRVFALQWRNPWSSLLRVLRALRRGVR